jgi:uncharacterized membrane protein
VTKMIYRPTVLTLVGAAVTLAAIAGTTGYVLGRAPALPSVLAVHFDEHGIADRFVPISYSIVFVPVYIQLTLAVLFGAIAGVLLYRSNRTRQAVEDEVSRQERERMLVTAEAISLLSAIWVTFQGLLVIRLFMMWQAMCCGLGLVYYRALVVAIVLSVIVGIRAGVNVRYPRPALRQTDPAHWRFMGLYVNRSNPAFFVPLRNGVGWTVNLGRPQVVVVIGVIVSLAIWAPLRILRLLLGQ